jgi:hypothetical protein
VNAEGDDEDRGKWMILARAVIDCTSLMSGLDAGFLRDNRFSWFRYELNRFYLLQQSVFSAFLR